MKVKYLYNILLTIGMALVFLSALSSLQNNQYGYLAISVLFFCILVWLKIMLLKDVKKSVRNAGVKKK